MTETSAVTPDKYFSTGQEWDDEIIHSLRNQRNMWITASIISLLIALMSVIAVTALAPLKTIEPIVIEVDKKTGRAEVVNTYKGNVSTLSVQEQLAKYFINKYLVARESYNPNLDLEENYLLVKELSEGEAFKSYAMRFKSDNPENLFARYKENTVKVKLSSISFLRDDTATVRYSLIEKNPQEVITQTHFIDILGFKFVNVPTNESSRLKNPLGFKVTEYRTDNEIIN